MEDFWKNPHLQRLANDLYKTNKRVIGHWECTVINDQPAILAYITHTQVWEVAYFRRINGIWGFSFWKTIDGDGPTWLANYNNKNWPDITLDEIEYAESLLEDK